MSIYIERCRKEPLIRWAHKDCLKSGVFSDCQQVFSISSLSSSGNQTVGLQRQRTPDGRVLFVDYAVHPAGDGMLSALRLSPPLYTPLFVSSLRCTGSISCFVGHTRSVRDRSSWDWSSETSVDDGGGRRQLLHWARLRDTTHRQVNQIFTTRFTCLSQPVADPDN